MADTARVAGLVLGPALAEGVIRRRPTVTAYAARRDLDGGAARALQAMRDRYGQSPLRLRVPGRDFFVILDPHDVDDVLARTPEPFSPATLEKKAALRHFQPRGVLISEGRNRERRRKVNESALDAGQPNHRHAVKFQALIEHEISHLNRILDAGRAVRWSDFASTWWRVVRQIVFGPAARDDEELTECLGALRSDANWAYLRRRRTGLRQRLDALIGRYVAKPDPDSLTADSHGAASQVPHWLFAFDAAGASTFRTLALLSTHPWAAKQAVDADYARACLLDTVRLYPTTLVILREAVQPTEINDVPIPEGASLIIHSGFFHRDPMLGAYADEFRPDEWYDGSAGARPGIVPFSAGPARCPGRNLVELTAAAAITAFDPPSLRLRSWIGPRPGPETKLPSGLDHFSLGLRRTSLRDG